MEYKIKQLAKILNLDINSSNDEVAKFIVEPNNKLLEALNILIDKKYYTNWCYEIDYFVIEIEKDTYTITISSWVDNVEINDAVVIKGCDFETISILMKLVKQVNVEV